MVELVHPDHPYVPAFLRRLDYLVANFRWAVATEAATGPFNESLGNLKRSLNPRAKRRATKVRLHPFLEISASARLKGRQETDDARSMRSPTPSEMWEACKDVATDISRRQGRPANLILVHYVHALMALIQEMTGKPALASLYKDSVYEPHMTSTGGRIVEIVFRRVDRRITTTTLVNIILGTHASGAIAGKSFRDLMPFYGGRVDQASGYPVPGPGYRLERFDRAHPIFSR